MEESYAGSYAYFASFKPAEMFSRIPFGADLTKRSSASVFIPERFGCIEDARAHCQDFFAWYNDQHCHSGIGPMTPHSMHYGLAGDMRLIRQATLDAAFMANPHRFNRPPQLAPMPTAAWINPPPQEKQPTREPVHRTLN